MHLPDKKMIPSLALGGRHKTFQGCQEEHLVSKYAKPNRQCYLLCL